MNTSWYFGMFLLLLAGGAVYCIWTWRKSADARRQERRDERRAEPK